ncbi:unnamed protein product [Paramecium octaurelia]|uniref:Uncharacterized protein n=1 Tax=Paramecium octaurelia TaxID=43137 RepID=A0A8S1S3A8_PAROT|nr:unnamed protein product [Paramecium octaurelia]
MRRLIRLHLGFATLITRINSSSYNFIFIIEIFPLLNSIYYQLDITTHPIINFQSSFKNFKRSFMQNIVNNNEVIKDEISQLIYLINSSLSMIGEQKIKKKTVTRLNRVTYNTQIIGQSQRQIKNIIKRNFFINKRGLYNFQRQIQIQYCIMPPQQQIFFDPQF